MAILLTTKTDFRLALKEELGFDLQETESNQLLTDLVRYFRLLGKLNSQVECPHKAQNELCEGF